MTSRNFGQFLKPPPPAVTLFITKALVLLSQNPYPSPTSCAHFGPEKVITLAKFKGIELTNSY